MGLALRRAALIVDLEIDNRLQGNIMTEAALLRRAKSKFRDPDLTAAGEPRARVPLDALRTLWINTGSLCNIDLPQLLHRIEPGQRPPRLYRRAPRSLPSSTRSRARRCPRARSASPAASRS